MENKKKDTRFNLTPFMDMVQNKNEHKSLTNQIDMHGYFLINNVKVYRPELACFFMEKKLLLLNYDTDKEEAINPFHYLETYIEAYNNGIKYFKENFEISANTIYGEKAEIYVNDVKKKYFGTKYVGEEKGWVYVKNSYPMILTHEQIQKIGYYSGIVSEVDAMVKKHETLFNHFDQPQQDSKKDVTPQLEYNTSQFNDETYNLFCHIVDEYKKDGNIKFINIWYFLKRDIDKAKYKNILFSFTQKTYKAFVKKYDIEIKKFKKADFKYKDDEVGILQNITDTYYTKLKHNENT